MRFVLGLVIGAGIGFAASVLFAPEKQKSSKSAAKAATPGGGSLGHPTYSNGANGSTSFKSVFESVRKQLNEAMSEAKKAQKEAEAEMTERYRRLMATTREK